MRTNRTPLTATAAKLAENAPKLTKALAEAAADVQALIDAAPVAPMPAPSDDLALRERAAAAWALATERLYAPFWR